MSLTLVTSRMVILLSMLVVMMRAVPRLSPMVITGVSLAMAYLGDLERGWTGERDLPPT